MKFGLIIPSSNTNMEAEFWRMARGWATVHTARMRLRRVTLDELEKMENLMLEAGVSLADAEVDILGYGCTSGSLFKGKNFDRKIERDITEKTGVPVVATARAVLKALSELKVKRVCMATPYIGEINNVEKNFFEKNGIEVLKIKGLSIAENTKVGAKSPDVAYKLAREVYVPQAQGLFISCTNFRSIEVIDSLEKELGVPVASSNTSTFWAMMRKAGIKKRIQGYGNLLSR